MGDDVVARGVRMISRDLGDEGGSDGNANAVAFVVACSCTWDGIITVVVEDVEESGCWHGHFEGSSYRGFEIRTCGVCALDFD